MTEFSMNIDDFSIGQIVKDIDKSECIITDKTTNSIEVFILKKTSRGNKLKKIFKSTNSYCNTSPCIKIIFTHIFLYFKLIRFGFVL